MAVILDAGDLKEAGGASVPVAAFPIGRIIVPALALLVHTMTVAVPQGNDHSNLPRTARTSHGKSTSNSGPRPRIHPPGTVLRGEEAR